MEPLAQEFKKFINYPHIRDFLYVSELRMLEKVLARLVKVEEDLEVCSDIISKAKF